MSKPPLVQRNAELTSATVKTRAPKKNYVPFKHRPKKEGAMFPIGWYRRSRKKITLPKVSTE